MTPIKTLLASLCVLILAAWVPLETSNNSVTRLSYEGTDFCSGVVVQRLNPEWVNMATAAHCAEATSFFIPKTIYFPNGESRTIRIRVFPAIRIKQNKVDEYGNVTVSLDMHADFAGWNKEFDVAIYKVFDAGYTSPATLSLSEPRYGEKVYSMGMPMAVWGSINEGVISKPRLGKVQGLPEFIPLDAIVHTAYMRPGISGGGLFDAGGALIGLTNWGLPGGPFLATRVSHVIDLLEKVNED